MLLVSGASATVAALGPSPWLGVLMVPGAGNRVPDGFSWALDNGAFAGFDAESFMAMLERHRARAPEALWCTAPDVVADAGATRERFVEWAPRIREFGYRVAYVLQDGETVGHAPWGGADAFFIGGSTKWKLSDQARELVTRARQLGKRTHMGRVNTEQRMRCAVGWGIDTIDGTQFSRFPDRWIPWALRKLKNLERQGAMPWT